jgi:hypothetical protein
MVAVGVILGVWLMVAVIVGVIGSVESGPGTRIIWPTTSTLAFLIVPLFIVIRFAVVVLNLRAMLPSVSLLSTVYLITVGCGVLVLIAVLDGAVVAVRVIVGVFVADG